MDITLEFESFVEHISNTQDLFEFKETKINLYNNTHGLGMHSKTLKYLQMVVFLHYQNQIKKHLERRY